MRSGPKGEGSSAARDDITRSSRADAPSNETYETERADVVAGSLNRVPAVDCLVHTVSLPSFPSPSIQEPEHPERNLVSESKFNTVVPNQALPTSTSCFFNENHYEIRSF